MRTREIVLVVAVLSSMLTLSAPLALRCPPLCFKHQSAFPLYQPLKRHLGPSMSLWTQAREISSAATTVCVSACFVAPVFYSGFRATLKVAKAIESLLLNNGTLA